MRLSSITVPIVGVFLIFTAQAGLAKIIFLNPMQIFMEKFMFPSAISSGIRPVLYPYSTTKGTSRPTQENRLIRNAYCVVPKDSGPCRGDFPKYYYNRGKQICEGFIYGGCGGNMNRFDSLVECQLACNGKNASFRG